MQFLLLDLGATLAALLAYLAVQALARQLNTHRLH